MTIEARMADGRIPEFPDGTDPQVIQATVKKLVVEKAVQESKLTTDAVSNSLDGRNMKIYKFKAPDGNTYRVEGPDGATEDEVKQELLEQKPEAFIPAKQVGMGKYIGGPKLFWLQFQNFKTPFSLRSRR